MKETISKVISCLNIHIFPDHHSVCPSFSINCYAPLSLYRSKKYILYTQQVLGALLFRFFLFAGYPFLRSMPCNVNLFLFIWMWRFPNTLNNLWIEFSFQILGRVSATRDEVRAGGLPKEYLNTVCPRSLGPFYLKSYYIQLVKGRPTCVLHGPDIRCCYCCLS